MTTERINSYQLYRQVRMTVRSPNSRLLGVFQGVTGREFSKLQSFDFLQPLRAKKLVALYNAGFEYVPTERSHYFKQPDGPVLTPGRALAIANQKLAA
jgi:hypothetical protein